MEINIYDIVYVDGTASEQANLVDIKYFGAKLARELLACICERVNNYIIDTDFGILDEIRCYNYIIYNFLRDLVDDIIKDFENESPENKKSVNYIYHILTEKLTKEYILDCSLQTYNNIKNNILRKYALETM